MKNPICYKDQGTNASSCEERIASLLAVHLVSHVLDEAYIIANAAEESGRPWRYLSILKTLRSGKLGDPDELMFDSNISGAVLKDNSETAVSSLATSTPQKLPEELLFAKNLTCEGLSVDDEDSECHQAQLSKVTSMFIYDLFDMSEVEKDSFETSRAATDNDSTRIADSISKILYSYVDVALGLSNIDNSQSFKETITDIKEEDVCDEKTDLVNFISANSDTSNNVTNLVALERVENVLFATKNLSVEFVSFSAEMHDGKSAKAKIKQIAINDLGCGDSPSNQEGIDLIDMHHDPSSNTDKEAINDDPYEHGYLNLNRDADSIDEPNETMKLEPKGDMFEVSLLDAPFAEELLKADIAESQKGIPQDIAAASSTINKKSGVTTRFRLQGSRLLACLRKWWRKKNAGKFREDLRINDETFVTPDRHNRSGTLQERKEFATPSKSYWKFNTINESALSKNSRWDKI